MDQHHLAASFRLLCRRLRPGISALLLSLAVLSLSGCGLMEDPIEAKKAKAKAEREAKAADSAAKEASPKLRLESYYAEQRKEKRTRKPADPDNKIVQCEVDGSTRMTRRFDCHSLGGREV